MFFERLAPSTLHIVNGYLSWRASQSGATQFVAIDPFEHSWQYRFVFEHGGVIEMNMRKSLPMASMLAICIAVVCGCQSTGGGWGPGQTAGTLFGGATGGVLGAALGSNSGKTAEGALIGGLTGAVLGNALGREGDLTEQEYQRAASQQYMDQMRGALSHDQVIQLVHSGLGDEVVANQIHNQGISRRPNSQELVYLKSQGVPDRVLAAMQSAWIPGETPRGRAAPYGPPPPVIVEEYGWGGPPVIYHSPRYWCPPPRRSGTYWGVSVGI